MNVSDQILDEIKERWANDLAFLEYEKNRNPDETHMLTLKATHPARDIRYLLNRLEAAEKAARASAAMNQKLYVQLQEVPNGTKNEAGSNDGRSRHQAD